MIELALPWLLLLLPLPFLVYRFIPKGTPIIGSALRIPFYSQLSDMSHQQDLDKIPVNWRSACIALIWFLLILACSNPQWLGQAIELPRSGRDIMLAVDISGSMQIPDMVLRNEQTNRLVVVRDVASEFIKHRVGDRLGLILFGTKAYLQTPLTYDRNTVITMLEDATIGLAGQETALGDAIGLSIKRLMKQPERNRILVLLTDGASNTGAVNPLEAAKLAAKYHIRIYTIGLGSDQMLISTLLGQQIINPSQNLDEETLKEIAHITKGGFFRAKNSTALHQIYQKIDAIEPVVSDKAVFRPITPLYHWPLGFALLLSLCLMLHHIDVQNMGTKLIARLRR